MISLGRNKNTETRVCGEGRGGRLHILPHLPCTCVPQVKAYVRLMDKYGMTAADVAREYRHRDVARTLHAFVLKGAAPDAGDALMSWGGSDDGEDGGFVLGGSTGDGAAGGTMTLGDMVPWEMQGGGGAAAGGGGEGGGTAGEGEGGGAAGGAVGVREPMAGRKHLPDNMTHVSLDELGSEIDPREARSSLATPHTAGGAGGASPDSKPVSRGRPAGGVGAIGGGARPVTPQDERQVGGHGGASE